MAIQATALRYDPYRKFKFLVRCNTKVVAAVSKVTALKKKVEAIDYRTGGDPNYVKKVPGLTSYEPITLERGISADPEFFNWMNLVNKHQVAALSEDEHFHTFRKDIQIEMYNLANEKVLTVSVKNAWPSEFTAVPDLDAKANEIAIETLILVHEGWTIIERVEPPAERF